VLETQLRHSISDLEASLQDKVEQLDRVSSSRQQEAVGHKQLQAQLSSLQATVSELEDTNIDIVTRNEELEREVGSLRRDSVQHLRQIQDLKQQQLNSTTPDDGKAEDQRAEGGGGGDTQGEGIALQQQQQQRALVDADAEVQRLQESLRSLQQALDAETSQHTAKLSHASSAEKKLKTKLASVEQQTQVLAAEVSSLQTQLDSQHSAMEAGRRVQKAALREKEEQYRTVLAELEEEKNTLEIAFEQVEEEKASLATALEQRLLEGGTEEASRAVLATEAQKQTQEAQEKAQKQTQEAQEEAQRQIQEAQEEAQRQIQEQHLVCVDLEEQLRASEAKHSELKDKFALFTEKTKVQVKKFIESQKASAEEKRVVVGSLEARESEVTSLRLKLDTVDHSLSDRKALSSELAERYVLLAF
jgi:chromosome segregation ATPase